MIREIEETLLTKKEEWHKLSVSKLKISPVGRKILRNINFLDLLKVLQYWANSLTGVDFEPKKVCGHRGGFVVPARKPKEDSRRKKKVGCGLH